MSKRLVGLMVRNKGEFELKYDCGVAQLSGVPAGTSHFSAWYELYGTFDGLGHFAVEQLRLIDAAASVPAELPARLVRDVSHLRSAARLRKSARDWCEGTQGLDEIILPTIWTQSEEYGAEEFQLSHSELSSDLRLLQSSEFPLILALAQGLESLYTFGRCYRYECSSGGDDGNHLLEFEQLVIARAGTSLLPMVEVAQELVIHLSNAVGVGLTASSFRRVGPRDLNPSAARLPASIDNYLMFTVPSSWGTQARRVFFEQLEKIGSEVYSLDTGISGDGWLSEPYVASRIAVATHSANSDRVASILDSARNLSMPPEIDITQAIIDQWNPTWNINPPVGWLPGERTDSEFPIRSITSARLREKSEGQVITDAELYLNGVEVAHVREYASRDQFLDSLREANLGEDEMQRRYGYLLNALSLHPGGLVGMFVGWERLSSVLLGKSSASSAQLLPRGGDGVER